MANATDAGRHEDTIEKSIHLFEGERSLVITGMLGLILAAGIFVFIYFQGPIILPEGNLNDAFSFNAAVGIFFVSIAAILPFARLGTRKRQAIRWLLILVALYFYGIETIQNFRGLAPRFTEGGTELDGIASVLFGVVALLFVILLILLMIQFFRIKPPYERPLLILGIRYALVSVLLANMAGIWMSILQDRFVGDAGNLIVLHGMGFHALQTLIIPGWLLEKTNVNERLQKLIIHYGGIAWLLSIILIGLQTGLGRSVFELTFLPILAILLLLVWLYTVIVATVLFIKKWRTKNMDNEHNKSFS